MNWVAFAAALVAGGAVSTSALADLHFSAETTSDGLRYILVSGDFGFDDSIAGLRSTALSHKATAITFDSPGGNVVKAMELGRLIRAMGLDTIQARGLDCASACAFAFFGGVQRLAEPGSIGVHKSWFPDDAFSAKDAVSAVQELTAEVMSYMREMGVDPTLVELSLRYESTDMRYLSGSEMEQYRATSTTEPMVQETALTPAPSPTAIPSPPGTADRPALAPEQTSPKFNWSGPEALPVDVAGRKVDYADIPGDTRPTGWVYINVCGNEPSRLAENLRTRLQGEFHSGGVRLLLARIGNFNPEIAHCKLGAHTLISFVQPSAPGDLLVEANRALMSVLYNYNVTAHSGKPSSYDDVFRYDVWLMPSVFGTPQPNIGITEFPASLPEATSGRIRHPSGLVQVKSQPSGTSANLKKLRNGSYVQILANEGRWYRVKVGTTIGFVHHTWVYVDQYESGAFDQRHVQVKSFESLADAEAYVQSSSIPTVAYLATNGWFAVTLRDTYDAAMAKVVVELLKQNGKIPDDAFVVFGNTYVKRVCCL